MCGNIYGRFVDLTDLKVYLVWVRALYCIHMIIVTIMFMDVVVMYAYGGVWCFGCIFDVFC